MKKIFTIAITALSINAFAQTTVCFNTPDGIDNTWTGGWSYKEYIVPTGYKIDSVYGNFDRTGYPASQEDFIFSYCAGTTVYNNTTATQPFDYSTTSTSLYDKWINLTSFNYTSVGVVRVFLPVNAGATWNDLCFAISPSTPTGINESEYNSTLFIYPNPTNGILNIASKNSCIISVFSSTGEKILGDSIDKIIDLSLLPKGLYFMRIIDKLSNTIEIKKIILQ